MSKNRQSARVRRFTTEDTETTEGMFLSCTEKGFRAEPKLKTQDARPETASALDGVFRPLVLGSAHALLDRRIGYREDG